MLVIGGYMLNNVPKNINKVTRQVVLKHPNSFNCEFYRRKVLRKAPIVGNNPTLGGMMVLEIQDESEIEWDFIGIGYALAADHFQPSLLAERQDMNYGHENEFRFLLEPDHELYEGGFEPQKNDVFYVVLGNIQDKTAPRVSFEIVYIETTINVPPYVPKYVCNRRDDLTPLLIEDNENGE